MGCITFRFYGSPKQVKFSGCLKKDGQNIHCAVIERTFFFLRFYGLVFAGFAQAVFLKIFILYETFWREVGIFQVFFWKKFQKSFILFYTILRSFHCMCRFFSHFLFKFSPPRVHILHPPSQNWWGVTHASRSLARCDAHV